MQGRPTTRSHGDEVRAQIPPTNSAAQRLQECAYKLGEPSHGYGYPWSDADKPRIRSSVTACMREGGYDVLETTVTVILFPAC